jgi:K+-transporting ATPase ATPase A chain
MSAQSMMLLAAFLAALLALAYPLGRYLAQVGEDAPIRGLGRLRRCEHGMYRLAGKDAHAAMGWKTYAAALLAFNALGALAVYGIQRVQPWLPLNPQHLANVGPDSSFNTAVSFVANTDWQGCAGETTMSYFTQMVALAGQNFFSAATGMAVVFALIRGFTARSAGSVGNFWVDITRSTLYVLPPLSRVFSVFPVGQGVIQNFSPYKTVTLLDPVRRAADRHRGAAGRIELRAGAGAGAGDRTSATVCRPTSFHQLNGAFHVA